MGHTWPLLLSGSHPHDRAKAPANGRDRHPPTAAQGVSEGHRYGRERPHVRQGHSGTLNERISVRRGDI